MCEGIVRELDGLDLKDRRLNERSRQVLTMLAADPQASINAAAGTWADAQAAYRLFANEKVSPGQILAPHREAACNRMQGEPVVLLVQDTTELDYSRHPARDAGCLNTPDRRGFYLHVQLAVTPQRLPLGVVDSSSYDRAPQRLGRQGRRTQEPIEEKETFRWLEGYRTACELAAQAPGTQVISVADAEADLYDLFVEALRQSQECAGPRADYIIRAHQDRCAPERDPEAGGKTYVKVRDQVAQSALLGVRTIELPPTPKREARTVHLAVRALSVTVKPPAARGDLPAVQHQLVLAEELDPPADGTGVCWLLATTLQARSFEEALVVLDYYAARWSIETYFRVLKTGCGVEELQLETTARLANCLAFYQIIAWRVLHLMHLSRQLPELPCNAVFADHEWQPVWQIVTREAPPQEPPQLERFVRVLAQLGGYNNKPSSPPPGPQTLWTAIRRMLDYSEAWLTFGPPAQGKAKATKGKSKGKRKGTE